MPKKSDIKGDKRRKQKKKPKIQKKSTTKGDYKK